MPFKRFHVGPTCADILVKKWILKFDRPEFKAQVFDLKYLCPLLISLSFMLTTCDPAMDRSGPFLICIPTSQGFVELYILCVL